MLSERIQVLLTPDQRSRVERIARERRLSVGAVIREAVETYIAPRPREEALRALEGLNAPVADWEKMKADILRGARA